jgi:hypothetical protein
MATSRGLAQFGRRVDKLSDVFLRATEEGVRKAVVVGDQVLLNNTAVDTGLHRGSWIASMGTPSSRVVKRASNISTSRGLATVLARWKAGKGSIFFTNNGPAIVLLDEGWSRLRPAGMSKPAIAAMRAVLRAHRTLRKF